MKIRGIFAALIILILNPLYAQEPGSIKFTGTMYGDYFYNLDNRDSSLKNLNGFQFRRIYFTADYIVSSRFDARIRLESDQTISSNTPGGRLGVMVKDAFIKWKNVFSGTDLFFGISATPSFEVSESAWGYRSLEKTILDFYGLVSSRDFGIDLKGRVNQEGSLRYWVKIANNSSNSPEQNKHKRFYGMLHFIPLKNFQMSFSADYATFPKKADAFSKDFKNNNALTAAFMLNVMEKDLFSFAVEPVYKMQMNNYSPNASTALTDQTGYGLSVFGWYAVSSLVRLAARYDTFDPNTDRDNDVNDLIIGAVDFRIDKNISLIPNVESVTYKGRGKKDLTGRVTMSFSF